MKGLRAYLSRIALRCEADTSTVSHGLQVKKIQHQDNYYDCGLYTLTYMEFFAFRTPMQIHPGTRFRGRAELELVWNDDFPKNEAFLSKRWFNQPNGSGLRVTLMLDLLNLMIEKARADGKQDELEKQILKAHWYITQFEENIRFVQLLVILLGVVVSTS